MQRCARSALPAATTNEARRRTSIAVRWQVLGGRVQQPDAMPWRCCGCRWCVRSLQGLKVALWPSAPAIRAQLARRTAGGHTATSKYAETASRRDPNGGATAVSSSSTTQAALPSHCCHNATAVSSSTTEAALPLSRPPMSRAPTSRLPLQSARPFSFTLAAWQHAQRRIELANGCD